VSERPDPITSTVIAHRLDAVAEAMALAMLRTARSPVLQARDFVTGVFTGDGRWVATKDYIPVLAGSMPSACAATIARFAGDVHPGDVFVLNDPFEGNNHAPDVTVLAPVFADGEPAEPAFWAVSKGHHADVGGRVPFGLDPTAATCWDEGLRIPPVRLVAAGTPVRDVWDLLLRNVRMPDFFGGDLRCQVGAVGLGEAELRRMLARFGTAAVAAAVEVRLQAGRRRMEAAIDAMRDGVYRAERSIESGGPNAPAPLRVGLTATVDGRRLVLDLRDSDPQVPSYVNSTRANTHAACLAAVSALVDPGIGRDSGVLSAIELLTEPGTVVDAAPPAPTALCTLVTSEALMECVWLALADAGPHGGQAGWARQATYSFSGIDEVRGRRFVGSTAVTRGGAGAVRGCDGWHGLGTPVAMGGIQAYDPELVELRAPVTVEGFELAPDTAGAGRWRGGSGAVIRCRIEQDDVALSFSGAGTTAETAPFGLDGGGAGAPAGGELERDGRREPLAGHEGRTLARGDRLICRMAGGGGHGDPAAREPAAVVDDVRAGVVSAAAARDTYRVAVDPETWTVDAAATAELRAPRAARPA
jgi:N-methylhydantoinase B